MHQTMESTTKQNKSSMLEANTCWSGSQYWQREHPPPPRFLLPPVSASSPSKKVRSISLDAPVSSSMKGIVKLLDRAGDILLDTDNRDQVFHGPNFGSVNAKTDIPHFSTCGVNLDPIPMKPSRTKNLDDGNGTSCEGMGQQETEPLPFRSTPRLWKPQDDDLRVEFLRLFTSNEGTFEIAAKSEVDPKSFSATTSLTPYGSHSVTPAGSVGSHLSSVPSLSGGKTTRDDGNNSASTKSTTTKEPYLNVKEWNDRYQELVEYRNKFGHCLVPYNWTQNPKLGNWVKRQRYQYKMKVSGMHSTLNKDRIQQLNSINFVWSSHDASWHEKYQLLLDFYKHHGHCNVPAKYTANPSLSIWVKSQRRQYKLLMMQQHCNGQRGSSHDGTRKASASSKQRSTTLTKERLYKLKSLGFVFDPCHTLSKGNKSV